MTFKPGKEMDDVFLRAKLRVGGGAWGDDAGDFAAHELLGEFGVLDLIADGNLVSLADELGDVGFSGVVGNSAHGQGDAIDLLARGEGDLQLAGGGDGVFEKKLVKVADAEKEQRGGMLFLIAACCRISGVEASLMGRIAGLERASIAEPAGAGSACAQETRWVANKVCC